MALAPRGLQIECALSNLESLSHDRVRFGATRAQRDERSMTVDKADALAIHLNHVGRFGAPIGGPEALQRHQEHSTSDNVVVADL